VLTIGPVSRFPSSKNLVSYLGLNPSEASSGGRQRLGAISKQGNSMMRYLLMEAAQTASRLDPEWRRDYQRELGRCLCPLTSCLNLADFYADLVNPAMSISL
jgi:transposase